MALALARALLTYLGCAKARWPVRANMRVSGFGGGRLRPALGEPVAVTVHLEDGDVVGQPVEQRAGEALGTEGSVHSSKGKLLVIRVEPRSYR